jgi:hypothetical protein
MQYAPDWLPSAPKIYEQNFGVIGSHIGGFGRAVKFYRD